jgi:hypothetical protein
VHLDLLPPHQRILQMQSWNPSRTAFVVLLTGSVLASQSLGWLGGHRACAVPTIPELHFHAQWQYFLSGIAMTAGFAALTLLASRAANRAAWSENFVRAGYAYLPLAFFGLFNVYLEQFISRGREIPLLLVKLIGFGNDVSPPQAASDLAVVQGLPPVLTVAGGVLSLYLLRKVRAQYSLHGRAYRLHQALILMTCFALLIIVWRFC